jgi:malonyl CoA-acyl carrier protein transacylase
VHLAAILDLIAERETTTGQAADRLREQIAALTTELARLDSELTDLVTTRTMVKTLAADQFTDEDPTIASAPYQQILVVLAANPAGMRAKDICLAVGVDPAPKHVEGARARLKRMVSRKILTETEPGIFTLAPKRT